MRVWGWIFLVLFILCGCSTTNNTKSEHADDDEFSLHEPDPLELFNRYMFGFNRILDAAIIKPAAIAYELGTPENFKYCTRSFIKNIYGPLNLVNYTLQGRIEKATTTTVRFILNTTLGFFGLIDFADFIGIKEEPTSFNEALTQSRLLEQVEQYQQVVTATATGAPVVVQEAVINGVYRWVVQMPLLVTYQSGSKRSDSNLMVTLVIVRVPTLETPNGIAIEQWIATSR